MNTETNSNIPAAELDSASLDQVVGGGGLLIERRLTADTTDTSAALAKEHDAK